MGVKGKIVSDLNDRDRERKGGCNGKVVQSLSDRDLKLKSDRKFRV